MSPHLVGTHIDRGHCLLPGPASLPCPCLLGPLQLSVFKSKTKRGPWRSASAPFALFEDQGFTVESLRTTSALLRSCFLWSHFGLYLVSVSPPVFSTLGLLTDLHFPGRLSAIPRWPQLGIDSQALSVSNRIPLANPVH